MGEFSRRLGRVLLITYLVALQLAVIYLAGEKLLKRSVSFSEPDATQVKVAITETPIPTPLPVPSELADLSANVSNANSVTAPPLNSNNSAAGLLIPVVGVKPEQLIDTFSDSRSENRSHDAIDIAAPAGTPVVAAADGEIVKLWDSEAGGITIYQTSADKQFVYYYAHLQSRAEGIEVGDKVRRGETIGYVGDTGNAGAGNYHLHFSVARITDPKRYWEGTYINPYPILRYGTSPQ
jgi:murein DD-endopeptidase MepM/ murein hydrolase activator NlpD